MKPFTVIIILISFGCGHTRTVSWSTDAPTNVAEMNDDLWGRKVRLELRDGRSYLTTEIRVSSDLTVFQSEAGLVELETSKIARLSYRDRKRGAIEGMAIGGLTLLPVAALSHSLNDGEVRRSLSVTLTSGAVAGFVWGAGIGALTGSRVTYAFSNSEGVSSR